MTRGHVTHTLLDATSRYPLTVLTAPLGYGKSTAAQALALQWATHKNWRVFVQTIGSAFVSPAHTWNRLAGQLAAQASAFGVTMQRMGFPADSGAMQRLFDAARHHLLAADRTAREKGRCTDAPVRSGNLFAAVMPPLVARTLVIIDDWHFGNSPQQDELLEHLIREELPGLSILLLSRTWPRIHLEELHVKGLAVTFDQSLLAFSEEETFELFRLHGEHDEERARAAWHKSEGWPAALWLRLSSRWHNSPPDAAGPDAPEATWHDVDTLLERAVFAQYDDNDKRLLLALSIPDSVTLEQARHLCDDPRIRERLLALHAENAFISRDSAGVYRMHSLMRAFLNRQLTCAPGGADGAARYGIDLPDLYRRLAQVHLTAGDLVQGAYALAKAGQQADQERILELFEHEDAEQLMALAPEGISALVLALPWPVRRARGVGYLTFLYFYIRWVDQEKGAALLHEAEQIFVHDTTETEKGIPGELALLRSFLSYGDAPNMRVALKTAHSMLNGRSRIARVGGNWRISPHAGIAYHRQPGFYAAHTDMCEESIRCYLELSGWLGSGLGLFIRAEQSLETGHFKAVNPLLTQAEHIARSRRQFSVQLCVAFCRARLALATGAPHNPLDALHGLAPEILASGHPMYAMNLELATSYMLALLGKTRQIAPWLLQGRFDAVKISRQGTSLSYIVHGKALLNFGQFRQLADYHGVLLQQFENPHSVFGLIHTHCLHAAALFRLQYEKAAMEALRQALDMARPDDIILPIVEYGSTITPLVQRMIDTAPRRERAYYERLLAHAATMTHQRAVFGETRGGHNRIARGMMTGGGIPGLTPKGREVLRLVAQGKSNVEIGQILGVKPVTVAKTLGIVYRTLGVRNRAEAAHIWACEREA